MKYITINKEGKQLSEGETTPPEISFADAKIKIVLGLANEISFARYWISLMNLRTPASTKFSVNFGPTDYNLNNLTKDFKDFDAILLTEWDHTFDSNALEKLWNDNLSVVAGIYRSRQQATQDNPVWLIANEDPYQYIKPPAMDKLFNVESTGIGFMLVRRHVFDSFGTTPFFLIEDGGADRYLCRKLRKKGLHVWIDPTVQVGHLLMNYIK